MLSARLIIIAVIKSHGNIVGFFLLPYKNIYVVRKVYGYEKLRIYRSNISTDAKTNAYTLLNHKNKIQASSRVDSKDVPDRNNMKAMSKGMLRLF